MNQEEKKIINQFDKLARPVDQVMHSDNKEIIKILKEIRFELRKMNSED